MAGPGLEDAGRHATEGRLAESHRDREVAEEPRRRRHPEGIRESLLQDDAESAGSVSFRVVPADSTTYPDLFRIATFPRLASSVVLARTANAMMQLALVLFTLQRFHSPTLAGVTVFLAIAPWIAWPTRSPVRPARRWPGHSRQASDRASPCSAPRRSSWPAPWRWLGSRNRRHGAARPPCWATPGKGCSTSWCETPRSEVWRSSSAW